MKSVSRYHLTAAPVLAALLFLIPAVTARAGFNEIMDSILAEQELSWGSAAWLVLTGSGALGDEATVEEAVSELGQRESALPEDPSAAITLGDFALLVMTEWKIPGGLMYSLTGAPRYALRELRFLGIVQGRSYPRMLLSGERALRILGRATAWKEGKV